MKIESLEARLLLKVPAGFIETTVVPSIPYASGMTVAPDGRVFVAQQKSGQIRVVKNGTLLPAPFATLPVRVAAETGLLGVAVDPQFASNGYLYAYWTSASPDVHNVVTRFTASGDVASANSRVDLINLPGPAQFHQGGMIGFGPDGKLYVPVGDHGDPTKAPPLTSTFGKILRFNKDGSIPSDNPFYGQTTGIYRSIWATGLRNPFQFDFQPGTGRLHINDVGLDTWEEINLGVAGANYGWPGIEGPRAGQSPPAAYNDPIYAYQHGTGDGAVSITGGAFYAGGPFPASYDGRYFFADFAAGYIKSISAADPSGSLQPFGTDFEYPIDLKRSTDGALWVLNHGDVNTAAGSLVKIEYVGDGQSQKPNIVTQPLPQTVPIGQQATFIVTAGGPGTLRYQWQRNGVDIADADEASYSRTVAAADNGALFRVVVSNANGSTASNAVALTAVSNQYPTPTIGAPAATLKYVAGQSISFSGIGTDPEDGTVPASRMSWSVVFYHDTHSHPFIDSIPGVSSGSFVVPAVGETAANVWYRIFLTTTDSGGLSRTTSRDIFPVKSEVTINASVGGVVTSGFALTLDGSPITSGKVFTGVAGIARSLGAPAAQLIGGIRYDFVGWSDGGAASHGISTPDVNTTYTARYAPAGTSPPAAELVRVNFQPAAAPTVSGYLVDAGQTFAARNGRTYGWTTSHTDAVVDRNKNSNQLLDTNVGVKAAARWELVVPNGSYSVKVSVGDAAASSRNNVYVEGISTFNYVPLATGAFASRMVSVSVTDGRLTVAIGSAATGTTRINYVEIAPAGTSPPPTSPPPTSPPPPPPPVSSPIRVNFQPGAAPTVAGYLVDAGGTFGSRNGQNYGWTVSHAASVVDRNKNSNQLLDTNVGVIAGGRWELAVANGTYLVTVSVGDGSATSKNNVYIEGVNAFSQLSLGANAFASKAVTVTVADGRLLLGIGSAATGTTRINYIEVTRL
ncbi:PQQ-dependent sugar dehydrogenase [Humisphaera borealis]|uniref:PQQ-dependent sugar dehydrogenase n=1 Tax=Humisphaera borealis TaxID=2807512 RepID=A0A7M2WWE5_9BACT|nr:PQQ-dependent sugar dehydrogenase [Humisphaera borealis]QOV89161.1 PQQ-dependent sugar dehydrogenase [Humisphaera borealis]